MGILLLVLLFVLLITVVPSWEHSHTWGYAPSGLVGLALIIVAVLVLTGEI